ncbi:fibrinogen-like protein A [Drosophila serrata]|uniref:fibrinogen-like protein A n=1 Tax=Drosophila serrata TaxID=7274 RepID=UPI000A1D1447|nr:fibrinogen-like protein A [Drosophila serrata]
MNRVCFVLGLLWLGQIYLACGEIGNFTDITEYSSKNEEFQSCEQYYSSCTEINPSVSGVYKIKVGNDVFDVYCDSTIAGKGWTVIQRRVSDEVNFYRKFSSYEEGFGDLNGSFWLGLDKLNKITSSESHELYVHLEDFNGETAFARYSLFKVGDVYSQYTLKSLGTYQGTAGDGLTYHLNQPFSTFDRDNTGCAKSRFGAWWYKSSNTVI